MRGGGARVHEVPEPLRAEDRQRRRDAVQDAAEVDVDHRVPLVDDRELREHVRDALGQLTVFA